MTNLFLAIKHP